MGLREYRGIKSERLRAETVLALEGSGTHGGQGCPSRNPPVRARARRRLGEKAGRGWVARCGKRRRHWCVHEALDVARATFTCDDCGESWCNDCLVPPVRKRAPTRCISCALIAGGVKMRGNANRGPMNMNSTRKRSIGK